MRKFYILQVLMSMVLGFGACYEDESNKDIRPEKPINIDNTTIEETLSVHQFDTLDITPLIYKEGVADKDLFFLWELWDGQLHRELGREMMLRAEITEEPSNDPYKILLTVTDSTTGIQEFHTYAVNVLKTLGEGLIVADTKDGKTSDLNLIMAFNFSRTYVDDTKDVVLYDLYSKSNGEKLEGLIKGVSYVNYTEKRMLTLLTDRSLTRLEPLDYKIKDRDQDAFIIPIDTILPQLIGYGSGAEYLVNDFKVHFRNVGGFSDNDVFGMEYLGEARCTAMYVSSSRYPTQRAILYDGSGNRFMLMPGYYDKELIEFQAMAGGAFDPGDMGNKECLSITAGSRDAFCAVMKDRGTGAYGLYVIENKRDDGKMGKAVYNLQGCTGIAQSKYYTASPVEDVLYYATDQDIYAAILTSANPSSIQRFNVRDIKGSHPADKITSMRLHLEEYGRMYLPDDKGEKQREWAQYRMLIITTYNEETKEGKVVTIPIETLQLGVLNKQFVTVYKGFGEILTVAPQGV